jgi:DTW domain-containing protein YfiP
VCYCHTINKVANSWPIHIFQHTQEAKHALNTARIAQLSLENCELFEVNEVSEAFSADTLLIYPGNDSLPLEEMSLTTTRPLIFLDGSWRKTKRMLLESTSLQSLQKVSIRPDFCSRYRIRKSPFSDGISTLEAIVSVLHYLDGDKNNYSSLLTSMDYMIEKQIELMGEEIYQRNYLKLKK